MISITLTEKGSKEYKRVIQEVCRYIEMLKENEVEVKIQVKQKWIFDEIIKIQGESFKYKKITNSNE